MSHEIQKADQTDGHDSKQTLIFKIKNVTTEGFKRGRTYSKKAWMEFDQIKTHISLFLFTVQCRRKEWKSSAFLLLTDLRFLSEPRELPQLC